MRKLFVGGRGRMGVTVAITFRAETKNERSQHESDDSFFFGREHEPVLELIPFPIFWKFQRGSRFSHDRIRSER